MIAEEETKTQESTAVATGPISTVASTAAQALEEVLLKWTDTDNKSPYLITNFVNNRNTLVVKKIKIELKQKDDYIPSGPTAYDQLDLP